jgi:hypothetical protein
LPQQRSSASLFAACATTICNNGNACARCGRLLDASNVSVVTYKDPQAGATALIGLTPQDIVKVLTKHHHCNQIGQKAIINAVEGRA